MKKLSSLLLVLLALLPCGAKGEEVTRTDDDNNPGSLRYAIGLTPADGEVTFALSGMPPWTIALNGVLVIAKNLTITGPGANSLTISGGNSVQIFQVNAPDVKLSGLTITHGFSLDAGGGIYHQSGTLTITRCAINLNKTVSGGHGAGVFSSGAMLIIRESVIDSNDATTDGLGGGIYVEHGGSLLLEASTINLNSAYNGGGLYVAPPPPGCTVNCAAAATLVNSTICLNTAVGQGGGIFNGGISSVSQCTVARNSAQIGGGSIHGTDGTVTLASTILAANSPGGNLSGSGGISSGYNLSDDGSAATFLTGPGDQNSVTSAGTYLSGLQDNGGPTLTIALLAGSSAIDAGDPSFTCACNDQRGAGHPRVLGGRIDIGAFEFTPPNHAPTVICPNPVTVDTAATAGTNVTLIASVGDVDGNPLTVTWKVDGSVGLPSTGGTPSSPSFSRVYDAMVHTVMVTVSDGIAAPFCSTTVTVLAPKAAKTAVRASLFALPNSTPNDRSKFDAAISYLDKSIDMKNWLDDSHPKPGAAGESVFNNEKSAVSQVQGLQSNYPTLPAMIIRLVKVDRSLAQIAIEYAEIHNGNAAKLTSARTYRTKGDTDTTAGKPTYAIDDYKNAWKSAVAATP